MCAASPPDAAKPTELDKFVAAHATVGVAAKTLGTPDSFAHEEYRGLNAFLLVDTSGRKRAVRWILVPERVVHIDPADAAKWSPNYLMDEIRARLAKGPVTFRLEAQMAEPGDPTSDPSKAWPEDDDDGENITVCVRPRLRINSCTVTFAELRNCAIAASRLSSRITKSVKGELKSAGWKVLAKIFFGSMAAPQKNAFGFCRM